MIPGRDKAYLEVISRTGNQETTNMPQGQCLSLQLPDNIQGVNTRSDISTTATEYIQTRCAGKHIWRQGHKGGNKVIKLLPMDGDKVSPEDRIQICEFSSETELLS